MLKNVAESGLGFRELGLFLKPMSESSDKKSKVTSCEASNGITGMNFDRHMLI